MGYTQRVWADDTVYIAGQGWEGALEAQVRQTWSNLRTAIEAAGGTRIKIGVIGEVGCGWPLFDNERKAARPEGPLRFSTSWTTSAPTWHTR